MDYLDPRKRLQHQIILITGYILIGIAIVIGTMVLVYQAYGFGLSKNGTVVQSGLVFFSSQPHPANIYLNGTQKSVRTNTRLSIQAGIYNVQLKRDGYRPWQRTIAVDGGSVEHFDYPFLFPQSLVTKQTKDYSTAPGFMSQSPDHRWLVIQVPGSKTDLEVYDLKNLTKPPTSLSLPSNIVSAGSTESWPTTEWADDNRHLVLQHNYDSKVEFILADRTDPAQSLNLNSALSVTPTKLTLNNKKYDQYYLYDATSGSLQLGSLKDNLVQPLLSHVLSYQSYSDDTVLYATDSGAPAGKVLIKLKQGDQTHNLRAFPTGNQYLLDLTKYSGSLYVVAGASNENKVYIYKNPVGQLEAQPGRAIVPVQVIHVAVPNYVSFSVNTQFIVAENATEFGVYDIENKNGYHYNAAQSLDPPQVHAAWMDGDRLAYVAGGKLIIVDYDNTNRQVLIPADGRYTAAFAPDYKYVYSLAPGAAAGSLRLNRTILLTPADQ